MVSYFYILVCTCALIELWGTVECGPWASPALEKLDELEDAQIYRAVVNSMQEWEKRRQEKQAHRRGKRQQPGVCYKDVGCFESSGPFGYLDMLPGPPEEIATKFLLYPGHKSRRSGFFHAEVPYNNLSYAFTWAAQGFNKTLPTKILIHGFGSDCSHIWVYELRSALMAVEEMNIICVDWAKGAELPNYVKAATNTRLVGKQLSLLLRGLIEQTGLLSSTIHLIGFSLGAHVAGFAGAELGNLSRITGLDPAGPLFESQDPRARLDQTDAEFVDVIHSNGENIILGGLGSWQPLGHVDFYPNGGRMQKGCTNIFVGAVSDIIWSSAIEGRSLCNHRRAYKFFTDSVSPKCHFPAFPCESYEAFLDGRCFPCTDYRKCGNMGYYADRSHGRGQLYLITRDEEPFCAHQYHVRIESSTSDVPITSYGKIQITLIGDSFLNETFVMTKKDDDEMKLGHTISRILVPHPVLAEPTQIQLLYTAYSGWISSGLAHWKIDDVTLSDSYGKSSSICKKGLVLESGIPVTLTLYPDHCSLSKDDLITEAQDRIFSHNQRNNTGVNDINISKESEFVPTPVIKIGNEIINRDNKNALKNDFDSSWQGYSDDTENTVYDEKETSRALNTRVIRLPDTLNHNSSNFSNKTDLLREVVEPILKPHSNKIARSHNPDKLEISEPILRQTTSKYAFMHNSEKATEFTYNFYDSNDDDWAPSKGEVEKIGDKWKRHDDSQVVTGFAHQTEKPFSENEGFNLITMTVQFLPQRLAKMFEQAEKYARETILPFVSAHTPKIIRNFIAPEEQPKYLPLQYNEDTIKNDLLTERKQQFNPPASFKSEGKYVTSSYIITTPYTNIQKISKRGEPLSLVFPETTTELFNNKDDTTLIEQNKQEIVESGKGFKSELIDNLSKDGDQNKTRDIYVNLPVFDENSKAPKYIPINNIQDEKTKKK